MTATKVCVIGAGSFGSAMVSVAAAGARAASATFDGKLRWWARRQDVCDEINSTRTNRQYYPGPLPEDVYASTDVTEVASSCGVCILALPSEFLPSVLGPLKASLGPGCVIVSLIKSLKVCDGVVVPYTRFLRNEFPGHPVAALMGPNLYREMARGEYAEATIGAVDECTRVSLQQLFTTDAFGVQCVSDVEAVDLCGCMKNTYTLACGFGEGLGWGSNVKAAIMRRGLLEIAGFLEEFLPADRPGAMSAQSVILEACGLGDLVLSCTVGRGQKLASDWVKEKGARSWEELERDTMGGMRIPDWRNLTEAHNLLVSRDSEAAYPLLSQTYHIAFGSAEPASLVAALRANPSISAPPAFSLRFSGYRALVTGAGNGIGRRIAERLVDLGAFVVAVDRAQSAIETVERKLSPHCKGIVADLSELQSLRTVVSEAGSVDLLVNSAGILVLEPFGEQTVDVWDKTMDINARCSWFLSHELGKGMAERRQGAIVNISSQSSSVAVSEKHMAYSTSKAAVDHITRLSAYALASSNVRVNAVNPTVVRTKLAIEGHGEEGLAQMAAKVPLQRLCEPDDVANAVLFLLSDKARMITGVTLLVDGGVVTSRP